MDRMQTLQLLGVASTAYPLMPEIEEEQIELWVTMLEDVPADRAFNNLKKHILSSSYPPVIADIARVDPPAVNREHELLRIETQQRFLQLEELAATDEPPPAGYWESVRKKIGGREVKHEPNS